MFDLTGKAALVTGATGGIGGAIARAFHCQGATVGLSGTRRDVLDQLPGSWGACSPGGRHGRGFGASFSTIGATSSAMLRAFSIQSFSLVSTRVPNDYLEMAAYRVGHHHCPFGLCNW